MQDNSNNTPDHNLGAKNPNQRPVYYCRECGRFNDGSGWRFFIIKPLKDAVAFINSPHIKQTVCMGCQRVNHDGLTEVEFNLELN